MTGGLSGPARSWLLRILVLVLRWPSGKRVLVGLHPAARVAVATRVSPPPSAPTILSSVALQGGACGGSRTYLGIRWPTSWRFWASRTVATTVAWLSRASLVSPNAMTFVYCMPSTIRHVWPWYFALWALGLSQQEQACGTRWSLIGLLAGSPDFVEVGAIALASLVALGATRTQQAGVHLDSTAVRAWAGGS